MGASSRAWVERQQQALLPVPYFHVVFTLPRPLGNLALYNKKSLYGLLMRISAEVVKTIAADKKYLFGQVGFVSVLHTWSQTMEHHPHVHMIVAGGALCEGGTSWRSCEPNFFLPTRVLGALFRRRFLEEVTRLRDAGELRFQGKVAHLADADVWNTLAKRLRAQSWVVYAKPPFGGPEQVVKYLARYTHRVAISNRRLLDFDGENVTFGVRPSAATNGAMTKTLTLDAFIERFLLHLLPKGFTRIRHYGFLAGRSRADNLARIRELLQAAPPPVISAEADAPTICSSCSVGHVTRGRDIQPWVAFSNSLIASTGPPRMTASGVDLVALARRVA